MYTTLNEEPGTNKFVRFNSKCSRTFGNWVNNIKYRLYQSEMCSRGQLAGFWPSGSSTWACHRTQLPHSFLCSSPESIEDDCRLFINLDLGISLPPNRSNNAKPLGSQLVPIITWVICGAGDSGPIDLHLVLGHLHRTAHSAVSRKRYHSFGCVIVLAGSCHFRRQGSWSSGKAKLL